MGGLFIPDSGGVGTGPVVLHDTTFSPVGLWQLTSDLNDTSGNAFHLTLAAGTVRRTWIANDLYAFYFDGSTSLIYNVVSSTLNIVGDLTIEALVQIPIRPPTAAGVLFSCGAVGETANDNGLYSLDIGTPTPVLDYFAEHDAGVDIIYAPTDVILPVEPLFHLALVRASNDVTFYVNGVQLGSTSAGLAAPTVGGAPLQKLRIGDNAGGANKFIGYMASVKIIASALTAAQVLAEYNLTLGPVFGGK